MAELTDDRLFQLNRLGIIPGPDELPADFIKRAEYCLGLKQELATSVNPHLPFEAENVQDPLILKEGCCQTGTLFDIAPVWIPVFFSNYQLSPWQGGCAWIFQAKHDSPAGALFQLREAFKKRKTYLKIYDRDELMAHELCHVGRMVFEEPAFEEFLAYQTSRSSFRRWFGPIVQSSTESMLFVLTLFLIFIADIAILATGSLLALKAALWLKLIPLALIIVGLLRLGWRHYLLARSLANLKTVLQDEQKARAVQYRLQDNEIKIFAHMAPAEIQKYVASQSSLRWDLIRKAYFTEAKTFWN